MKQIFAYHRTNPLEGYRRMTFMMLDEDVVAVSPASVYRVLSTPGLLDQWSQKPSKRDTGFEQPLRAHQHWHIDAAYLNIAGTFYYFCSIRDGFSRAVVHWEIRVGMREADVETILQRGCERHREPNLASFSTTDLSFSPVTSRNSSASLA